MHNRIIAIKSFSNPAGDYLREGVQAYFRDGLGAALRSDSARLFHIPMYRLPGLITRLNRISASRKARQLLGPDRLPRIIARLTRIIGGRPRFPHAEHSATIAEYRVVLDGGSEHSFHIDVADSPEITDDRRLASSLAYFKTNYAIGKSYPAHVFPLFNVGPDMPATLRRLHALRRMPKQYDLSFVVRVWGGTNELDGIEHNLRLIEALSKVRCNKFFHVFLIAGDTNVIGRRLDAQGIRWSARPLTPARCVEIAAQSRLSVVRHAIHSSIPWSSVEKMAVGTCILLDHSPFMQWHVPLMANRHFVCLGTDVDPQTHISTDTAYAEIPAKVERLLSDRQLLQTIGGTAAAYFDANLRPEQAGTYILSTLTRQVAHLR